jgi:hypothetical protein
MGVSLRNNARTVVAVKDSMTLKTCPESGTLAPSCCDVIFGVMVTRWRASTKIDTASLKWNRVPLELLIQEIRGVQREGKATQ